MFPDLDFAQNGSQRRRQLFGADVAPAELQAKLERFVGCLVVEDERLRSAVLSRSLPCARAEPGRGSGRPARFGAPFRASSFRWAAAILAAKAISTLFPFLNAHARRELLPESRAGDIVSVTRDRGAADFLRNVVVPCNRNDQRGAANRRLPRTASNPSVEDSRSARFSRVSASSAIFSMQGSSCKPAAVEESVEAALTGGEIM